MIFFTFGKNSDNFPMGLSEGRGGGRWGRGERGRRFSKSAENFRDYTLH